MEESTVDNTNEVSPSTSPPTPPTPKTSRGLHGPSLGIGAGIAIVSIISAFMAVNIMDTSPELEFEGNSPTPTSIPTQQPTQPPGPQLIQGLLDDDPVKGNPDAIITIVEFSDYQCPFCQRFHQTTLPLILENYVDTGKVKFVYRDYPIQSLHPNGAFPAAVASECADEQGMFWQYHDKLFQTQKKWERLATEDIGNEFKTFAVELGLDANQFNDCFNSGKYLDEINNDLQDGTSYGITGTPGFFIGNDEMGYIKVSGAQPYSVFQNILNQMLAS
jgi:protein-disulfide isomerase